MTEKQKELDPEFLKHVLDDKSAERHQRAVVDHVAKNPALKHAIAERNALVAEDDEKRLGLERAVAERMLGQIAEDVTASVVSGDPTPKVSVTTKPRVHVAPERETLRIPRVEGAAIAAAEDVAAPAKEPRSSAMLVVGALVVLGLVGVGGWFAFGRGDGANREPLSAPETSATNSTVRVEPTGTAPQVVSPPESTTAATTVPPRPSASVVPTLSAPRPPATPPTASTHPKTFGSGWTIHEEP